jgi:hypothetical protein
MNEIKWMELFDVPEHCVYAFVCDESKRFMVGHTKHLFTAIGRIKQYLETPKYAVFKSDIKSMRIQILETNILDHLDKKIKVAWYTEQYKAKGYVQYFPSNLVKYTVNKYIYITQSGNMLYCAYLQDGNKKKYTLGLFKTEEECDEFINKHYPNTSCIYAIVLKKDI